MLLRLKQAEISEQTVLYASGAKLVFEKTEVEDLKKKYYNFSGSNDSILMKFFNNHLIG